jgi:hypothetical protein
MNFTAQIVGGRPKLINFHSQGGVTNLKDSV